MSVLKTLTENIVKRDLSKDGAALLTKWEKTGLLEGISDDYQRNTLAVLLENQAKELLREATTMATGDVEGYAAVAFPIVRRVFGGLIANDLVSVQPMSLPSGLVFFLDFTKHAPEGQDGQLRAGVDTKAADVLSGNAQSIYGGGEVGSGIMNGLDPSVGGVYNLQQGLTASRGAAQIAVGDLVVCGPQILLTGAALTEAQQRMLGFDADLLARSDGAAVCVARVEIASDNGQTHTVLADATGAGVNSGAAAAGNPIQSQAGAFQRCMGYGNNAGGGTLTRTTPRGGLTHIELTQADASAVGGDGSLNADTQIVRRLTRIVQVPAAGEDQPGITANQAGASIAGRRYLEFVVLSASGNQAGGFAAAGDANAAVMAVEFAKMDNLQQTMYMFRER